VRALPPKTAVPCLAVTFEDLTSRALDHRQGFLVSLADGASTIETLLDLCGMPEEEALALFADLVAQGILALR
jgi:hypothetical protein